MERDWNLGPATRQQCDLYAGQLLSLKEVKNLSINVVLRVGCILSSVSMNVHLRVLLPSTSSHLYLEQERAEGVGRLLEVSQCQHRCSDCVWLSCPFMAANLQE